MTIETLATGVVVLVFGIIAIALLIVLVQRHQVLELKKELERRDQDDASTHDMGSIKVIKQNEK